MIDFCFSGVKSDIKDDKIDEDSNKTGCKILENKSNGAAPSAN